MSEESQSGLEELLECPICLCPLVLPITLPCGHTFCTACLKSKHYKQYIKKICPICRKPLNIPLSSIRPTLILDKLLSDRYGKSKLYQEKKEASRKLDQEEANSKYQRVKLWLKRWLPWLFVLGLVYHLLRVKINAFLFSLNVNGYKIKALKIAESIRGEDSLDFKFLLFSQFIRVLFSNLVFP